MSLYIAHSNESYLHLHLTHPLVQTALELTLGKNLTHSVNGYYRFHLKLDNRKCQLINARYIEQVEFFTEQNFSLEHKSCLMAVSESTLKKNLSVQRVHKIINTKIGKIFSIFLTSTLFNQILLH